MALLTGTSGSTGSRTGQNSRAVQKTRTMQKIKGVQKTKTILTTKASKPKRTNKFRRTGQFRFLELPAELRNIVYAYAAEDDTAHLKKGQRQLFNASALSRVNDQIRHEYSAILTLCANTIKTGVVDFDFRHVVAFLNTLSTVELNTLPGITKPSMRKIEVTLSFLAVFEDQRVDDSLLRRWLNRVQHPTKKGAQLDFTYVRGAPLDGSSLQQEESLVRGSRPCWTRAFNKWRIRFNSLAENLMLEERRAGIPIGSPRDVRLDEVEKIHTALWR